MPSFGGGGEYAGFGLIIYLPIWTVTGFLMIKSFLKPKLYLTDVFFAFSFILWLLSSYVLVSFLFALIYIIYIK
ncbi:MAG: hypothetical protein NZ822_03175, partial [Patescibacteria group bacterium]|nr:hypothetical protein [Patescibacteria group bacterium]